MQYTEGNRHLGFQLTRVQAIDQMGGSSAPLWHPEITALVHLKTRDQARDMYAFLAEEAKPDFGEPFTREYKASLPVKRASLGLLAYFYISWTAAAGAIMVGILLGLGAPLWITVPLVAGGCYFVFRRLQRWQRSAEARSKTAG